MIESSLLLAFIPTWFLIAISPGMCMTLAMSLGISIGLKRTFYMMWGELLGVGLVAVSAVLGVAALFLNYPLVFSILKWLGGAYLVYLGVMMWLSRGRLKLDVTASGKVDISAFSLFSNGFITAIANPKGWAFTAAIIPPFINQAQALTPQIAVLVAIILISELICMVLYASGGHGLKKLLKHSSNVKILNRISGSLMIGVGVWLALG